MPKSTEATKSRMKLKSMRKPLRDVSNAKTAIKPSRIVKKKSEEQEGNDNGLDRLLLVHSDLSSILSQIDELVVQALQLRSKKGREEVKQFADVLSEMRTSLKPWTPRFQKVVSCQSVETENKSEQQTAKTVLSVPEEDAGSVIESPEQTEWESLISPSPLVSWRAECNTEGGRQLFLLTPLPQRKTISSKFQKLVVPANKTITIDKIVQPVSLFNSVSNLSEDLPEEGLSTEPTPNKVLNIELTKTNINFEMKCPSPATFSRTNCPMFVMTPHLKMSPPKSCKMLEPVSEYSRKKKPEFQGATPFPAGSRNTTASPDYESSSDQASDDLTLKYPELFGIKLAHTMGNKMKVVEESQNWNISPPKTCAIMEPSDEKTLSVLFDKCSLPKTNLAQPEMSSMKGSEHQCDQGITTNAYHHRDSSNTLGIAESTPMMKEPASSFRTGKHPGENTLKKELWTRFEAATTHGVSFNGVALQNTFRKGFLDRLDEASDV